MTLLAGWAPVLLRTVPVVPLALTASRIFLPVGWYLARAVELYLPIQLATQANVGPVVAAIIANASPLQIITKRHRSRNRNHAI